ncbi:hypothetical protein [Kluyvera intermedia]|jgi:hypothetical protein|uniref:hypothetical protein n=1 Tax=Kluyvera intermedia TaxID=61648 RepID=UPI000786FD75
MLILFLGLKRCFVSNCKKKHQLIQLELKNEHIFPVAADKDIFIKQLKRTDDKIVKREQNVIFGSQPETLQWRTTVVKRSVRKQDNERDN